MSYLKPVCKMYKVSQLFLVDDPEPSQEPDVKVVNVFKISMYLIELPLKSLKNSWFW